MKNIYQWIPGVDKLLLSPQLQDLTGVSHFVVMDSIRRVLDTYREDIGRSAKVYYDKKELKDDILADILREISENQESSLKPVINATGVVLHTNLGRAVLSKEARRAVELISEGYGNLELNLATGERGSRYSHVEKLLIKLTGAEDCIVVNNNAAAVLLALDTLARGKKAVVSRGQLVEIGGAFRIPEVMERSGAELVEVGTTNKTNIEDYEGAVTGETGLLLKVHTSNYRIIGFTHEPSIDELVLLGNKHQIPLMEDLGSGCLIDLKAWGVGNEPTVQQVVASGVDVVTFSGDKLLGGPQGGIIVGKEKYVSQMKKNPLTRAFRIDKMTVAALEATLKSYLDSKQAVKDIPTLEMLTRSLEKLEKEAYKLKEILARDLTSYLKVEIEKGVSQVGGGSLPGVDLPTFLVTLCPKNQKVTALAAALREGKPPILTYIKDNRVMLDPRTILADQYAQLSKGLKRVCGGDQKWSE